MSAGQNAAMCVPDLSEMELARQTVQMWCRRMRRAVGTFRFSRISRCCSGHAGAIRLGWFVAGVNNVSRHTDDSRFGKTFERDQNCFTLFRKRRTLNVSKVLSTVLRYPRALPSRYDEINSPGYSGEGDMGAGHFTQVVWKESTLVGAAFNGSYVREPAAPVQEESKQVREHRLPEPTSIYA